MFTHEQYEKLLSLIQQTNITSNQVSLTLPHGKSPIENPNTGINHISFSVNSCKVGSWIVDSGASHHICSSLQYFDNYHSIEPVSVKLPNGHFSLAKYAGTVTFSPGFCVSEVFHVPDFSLNLLSVTKLCASLNCIITFTAFECLIQEQKTKRMIGLPERHEGLYHLVVGAKSGFASSSTVSELQCLTPCTSL